MAEFQGFNKKTTKKLNKKGVGTLFLAAATVTLLLLAALFFFKSYLSSSKKKAPEVKTITPTMAPSSIRYHNLEEDGYEIGTDYVLLKHGEETVKVDSEGNVSYVKDGKNIEVTDGEEKNEIINRALDLAKNDTGASVALSGLEKDKKETEEERLQKMFEKDLSSALEKLDISEKEYLKYVYALDLSPDMIFATWRNGKDLAEIISGLKTEWEETQLVTTEPKEKTENKRSFIEIETSEPSSSSSSLANVEQVPDWLQPIDPTDSLAAIMTSIGSAVQPSSSSLPQTVYDERNGQTQKESWLKDQQNSSFESKGRLTKWDISVGTIIPITLITGLNTDMPGQIVGQVRSDVYDSLTGLNVLIPKGSRVIANYNSAVTFGQTRVGIAWKELITPDGYMYTLPGFLGVDGQGYAGNSDKHSNHFFSLLAGAMLASVIDYSAGTVKNTADTLAKQDSSYEIASILAGAAIGTTETVLNKYTDLLINRQPTIKIRPGAQIIMLATSNINLKR